jgi:hypothetical protein
MKSCGAGVVAARRVFLCAVRFGNTRISGGFAVLYDPTIIQLFTRPYDQYTLTDIYANNGTLLLPNALSYYTFRTSA